MVLSFEFPYYKKQDLFLKSIPFYYNNISFKGLHRVPFLMKQQCQLMQKTIAHSINKTFFIQNFNSLSIISLLFF
jgi:hypothetical protein